MTSYDEHGAVIDQKYYQWVCFVLFFQALLFYIPRYLWKTWEGGRIRKLVQDLDDPEVGEDIKVDRKRLLVDYCATNLRTHNSYAARFFICEVLNFINVVGQMSLTNYFLHGEFTAYGFDVFRFTEMRPEDRTDPMNSVFPKVTECSFHTDGPSDAVHQLHARCVLHLNIINERIYVILWFWFVFLSVVTGIELLYQAAVIAFPQFRNCLLRFASSPAHHHQIQAIARKSHIGDWFVLHLLGCNMHPTIYNEVLVDLAQRLSGRQAMKSA
jgi:hypothetical protein